MLEIDRYALAMTAAFQREVLDHYERYEFHPVVARLQTFCSEDLGAFYLDILKDRLYTTARRLARAPLGPDRAVAHHRRAARADGADPVVHRRGSLGRSSRRQTPNGETIFTQTLPRLPGVPDHEALLAKWTQIRASRAEVLKQLEEAARTRRHRLVAAGRGRSSRCRANVTRLLASLGDDLKFVLITSQARVCARWRSDAEESITVTPSAEREVRSLLALARRRRAQDAAHPALCGRCVAICSAPASRARWPDARRRSRSR